MCAVNASDKQSEAQHVIVHAIHLSTYVAKRRRGVTIPDIERQRAKEEAQEVLDLLDSNPGIRRTPEEIELINSVLQD